jgi:hypothetical protein
MPDLDTPCATYDEAATPGLMAPSLPVAIRETIEAWGRRHGNVVDVQETLRAIVVVTADLITQAPDLATQAQGIVYVEDALRYACSTFNEGRHPSGTPSPAIS